MASYGNLSLSDLIVYNSTSDASASLTFDTNSSDGNFAFSNGANINGNVFIESTYALNVGGNTTLSGNLTAGGTNTFSGTTNITGSSYINGPECVIPFSGGGDVTLTFPSVLPGPSNVSSNQAGLGIYWNASTGSGETDLIGYGQASGGGISIFGITTSNGDTFGPLNRIADFFPGTCSIYANLDVSGTLLVKEGITTYEQISLSSGSSLTELSMISGSSASSTFLGVSTSLQIGSNTSGTGCYLQIQNGSSSGNLSYNTNSSDGNFAMSHGLDINGELNLSGLLNTTTSSQSGGGIYSNMGVYTYYASLGNNIDNVKYGFNFVNGGGILIITTNNYNNYDSVWGFAGVNGGIITTAYVTNNNTSNFSINTNNNSSSGPSVYTTINTNSSYTGGNIYFTIIGVQPTSLTNLTSLF
jgi:hypothetical protein